MKNANVCLTRHQPHHMPQCTSLKYSCALRYMCMCVLLCNPWQCQNSRKFSNSKLSARICRLYYPVCLFVPSAPPRFGCSSIVGGFFVIRRKLLPRRHSLSDTYFLCAANALPMRSRRVRSTSSWDRSSNSMPPYSASSLPAACFVIAVDQQTIWDAPAFYYPLTAFAKVTAGLSQTH